MAMNIGGDFQAEYMSGTSKGMGSSYEKTNVHSISMTDGLVPEAEVEEAKAEVQRTTLQVVVLAGSFGKKLVKDIKSDIESTVGQGKVLGKQVGGGGDRKYMGSHAHLLRGGGGKEHIPKGMVKLAETTIMEHLLIMLRKCERLDPVEKNLFFVVNEAQKHEFDVWTTESDVQFPPENVMSNGLSDPDAPQSNAVDLQAAIEHFGLGGHPLLVIQGDLCFFPDYNFQRVVEHCMVRGKDCIGFYDTAPGQLVTEPAYGSHATVEMEPGVSVRKLVAYHDKAPKASSTGEPEHVVAPLFMLRKSSVPYLAEYLSMVGPSGHLFGFMSHLTKQVVTYGVDLEFGRFDVGTLENCKFAEAFFNFYVQEKAQVQTVHRVSDTDSSVSFKTEFSNVGDGAKYKKDSTATQVIGRGEVSPALDKLMRDFVTGYFVDRSAQLSGKMESLVPPTFYMTEYRRQVLGAENLLSQL